MYTEYFKIKQKKQKKTHTHLLFARSQESNRGVKYPTKAVFRDYRSTKQTLQNFIETLTWRVYTQSSLIHILIYHILFFIYFQCYLPIRNQVALKGEAINT